MIQATELMIGDWVDCLESTHTKRVYAQVEAIEEYHSILVKKDITNWFLDLEDIAPVPLTKEILEKNFAQDNTTVIYEQKIGYFDCSIGNNDTGYCYPKIKYVHQLQHALKLCNIQKEIQL